MPWDPRYPCLAIDLKRDYLRTSRKISINERIKYRPDRTWFRSFGKEVQALPDEGSCSISCNDVSALDDRLRVLDLHMNRDAFQFEILINLGSSSHLAPK